ncbi:MAG TPA: hypothetical protein VF213_04315, partial [Dongiaceae bacterium]
MAAILRAPGNERTGPRLAGRSTVGDADDGGECSMTRSIVTGLSALVLCWASAAVAEVDLGLP